MKFLDLLTPSSSKHSNHVQRSKPEAFEGRDYHNERDTKIGWKNGAGERTRTPEEQIKKEAQELRFDPWGDAAQEEFERRVTDLEQHALENPEDDLEIMFYEQEGFS